MPLVKRVDVLEQRGADESSSGFAYRRRRFFADNDAPAWAKKISGGDSLRGRAAVVQVDIPLTPRFKSDWFQLLESTSLSSHCFQIDSTCTPKLTSP